ncbi:hypothetical protein MMPV_006133 [Pyropia vietnamensis]
MAFFQHYRFSTVGLALQEVLEDIVDAGAMGGDTPARLLLLFDQAISSALRTHVRAKAIIRGVMHYYRNVESIFTFYLRSADIELEGVDHHVSHPVQIIAVDGRVPGAASAARLRRPAGAGADGGGGGVNGHGRAATA